MQWLALIGALLELAMLVLKEYFSASAEAKKKDEEYKLDEKRIQDLIFRAMERMRADQQKDSRRWKRGRSARLRRQQEQRGVTA